MNKENSVLSEKVADIKALGQCVSDFSAKHKESSVLLDLWFLDTVEDRIVDSKSDCPSYVMKKSLDEILNYYFEKNVLFTLQYGYEDNSEAINDWLIENGFMGLVDDEEEVA